MRAPVGEGLRLVRQQQAHEGQQAVSCDSSHDSPFREKREKPGRASVARPGMVLVNGDQAEWVKRPETLDEVFARDVVPDHLADIG